MTIQVGDISMQRFRPEHTDALYQLINKTDVRKGMSNSAGIGYESHVSWVKANLLETDRVHLFIVTHNDQALGAALIKNIKGNTGEIGIMVSDILEARETLFTGKLLTGILYYFFHHLDLQCLTMSILPDNINSLTTTKKIGADFKGEGEVYRYFALEKSKYQLVAINQLLLKRYQPYCIE
nr:GNAT family N-acetyltransferase [uncultured Pedobacter sp.]